MTTCSDSVLYTLISGCAVLLLLLILTIVLFISAVKNYKAREYKLVYRLGRSQRKIRATEEDLSLLRGVWTIKPNEIVLKEVLAKTNISTVYEATLRGKFDVAVKIVKREMDLKSPSLAKPRHRRSSSASSNSTNPNPLCFPSL